jgi:sec-independent protein translocase protein TatA
MSPHTTALFAAFGIGGTELLIILAIVLLLFGGAKLPQLARGLGQSMKEFKKASKDDEPVPAAKEELKKPDSGPHGTN